MQGCAATLEPFDASDQRYHLLSGLAFANACFDARAYTWGAGIRMRATARLSVATNPPTFIAGEAVANVSMVIRPHDLSNPFERSVSMRISVAGRWPSPLGIGGELSINNATFSLESSGDGAVLLAWTKLTWDLDIHYKTWTIRQDLLLEMAPHTDARLSPHGLPRLGCKMEAAAISLADALGLLAEISKLAGATYPWRDMPVPNLNSGAAAAVAILGSTFAFEAEMSLVDTSLYTAGLYLSIRAEALSFAGFSVDVTGALRFRPNVNDVTVFGSFANDPLQVVEESGFSLMARVTLPLGIGEQSFTGRLSRRRFFLDLKLQLPIAGFNLEAKLSLEPSTIRVTVHASFFGLLGDVASTLTGELSPTRLSLSGQLASFTLFGFPCTGSISVATEAAAGLLATPSLPSRWPSFGTINTPFTVSLSMRLGVLGAFSVAGTVSHSCAMLTATSPALPSDSMIESIKAAIRQVIAQGSTIVDTMVQAFLELPQTTGVTSAFELGGGMFTYSIGTGCSSGSGRRLQAAPPTLRLGMLLQDVARDLSFDMPSPPTFEVPSGAEVISKLNLDQPLPSCLSCPVASCGCTVACCDNTAKATLAFKRICNDGSSTDPSTGTARLRVRLEGDVQFEATSASVGHSSLKLLEVEEEMPIDPSWAAVHALTVELELPPAVNVQVTIPFVLTLWATLDASACAHAYSGVGMFGGAVGPGGAECFVLERAGFEVVDDEVKIEDKGLIGSEESTASRNWTGTASFSYNASLSYARQFKFSGILSRKYSATLHQLPDERVCTRIIFECHEDTLEVSAVYDPGLGFEVGCSFGFALPLLTPTPAYQQFSHSCLGSHASPALCVDMVVASSSTPRAASLNSTVASGGRMLSQGSHAQVQPKRHLGKHGVLRRLNQLKSASDVAIEGWNHAGPYYVTEDFRRVTNWLSAESIKDKITSSFDRSTILTALGDMRATWQYSAEFPAWGAVNGLLTVEASPSGVALTLEAARSVMGVSLSGQLSIDAMSGAVVSGILSGSGAIDFTTARDSMCGDCPLLGGTLTVEITDGAPLGNVYAVVPSAANPFGISPDFRLSDAHFNLTCGLGGGGQGNSQLVWGAIQWDLIAYYKSIELTNHLVLELPPHSDAVLSASGLPRLGCRVVVPQMPLEDGLALLASLGRRLTGVAHALRLARGSAPRHHRSGAERVAPFCW